MRRQLIKHLMVIGVILIMAVAAGFSMSILTAEHELVNIFAGGRSYSKVLALGAYVILLTLVSIGSLFFKTDFKINSKRLVKIGLAIVMSANLTLLVYSYIKYKLDLLAWHVFVNGDYFTSVSLAHNQLGKVVVAKIISLFGGQFSNLDYGQALLAFLPSGLIWFYTTLLIILFLCFLVFFWQYLQQVKSKIVYLLIFAISSFGIFKNLLDGGIFSAEFLLALGWFSFVFLYKPLNIKRRVVVVSLYALISTILIIIVNNAQMNWPFFIFYVGAYNALFLFIYQLAQRKFFSFRPRLFYELLVLYLVVVGIFVYKSSWPYWQYHAQQTTTAETWLVVQNEMPTGELVANCNNYYLYSIQQPTIKYQRLLQDYDLLDNYFPIQGFYTDCFPRADYQHYEFQVVSENDFQETNFAEVARVRQRSKEQQINGYKYYFDIYLHPCLPNKTRIINQLLNQAGLEKYIILEFSNLDI